MPIVPPVGILNIPNATVRAGTIEANALSIQEISLNVTQSFDEIVQGNNTCETNIIISNTLPSTSATTGALTVAGGLGVAGNLYASNVIIQGVSVEGTPGLQNVTEVGPSTDQAVHFTNTTASTSATTGAVKVEGGLGVGGNVHASSNLFVTGNVGIGTTEPTETLDIVGNLNLQKVSNTASIKLNSNVVTEYTRSKKLIKYPRVAMTATTTAGYTASANSEYSGRVAWEQFDSNPVGSSWETANNSFDSNGDDVSGDTFTANGVSYTGHWAKLQLPERVILYEMTINCYNDSVTDDRRPKRGVVLGSNDNSTWALIHRFNDDISWSDLATNTDSAKIAFSHTQNAYEYILFLVEQKYGTTTRMAIFNMEYYGTPEYDPEAHGTDVIVRSVPNVPNTDWLEVYYDARNYSGSGDVQDETTNNRDGSLRGDTSFSSADGIHKFDFDGSGDYIESLNITSIVGNQPLSSSLWVKFTSWTNANYDFIFSLGDRTVSGDGKEYSLTVNHSSNRVYIGTDGSGGQVLSGFTLHLGRWYHFATTYDGAKNYLYIDGGTFSSSESLSGSMNFPASGCDLVLGADTTSSRAQFMNGSIANFRLFNRALTGDEVWQLYTYQKEYFGHGNLDMALKSGRLGIGTTEPRAVLDVKGDAKIDRTYTLVDNIVAQHTVRSDTQTVEFTGLNLDEDGGTYKIVINMKNATTSNPNMSMYINDVTTSASYYSKRTQITSSKTLTNANNEIIFSLGNSAQHYHEFKLTRHALSGYPVCTGTGMFHSGTGTGSGNNQGWDLHSWVYFGNVNVTKLKFDTYPNDAIEAGSVFTIYKYL